MDLTGDSGHKKAQIKRQPPAKKLRQKYRQHRTVIAWELRSHGAVPLILKYFQLKGEKIMYGLRKAAAVIAAAAMTACAMAVASFAEEDKYNLYAETKTAGVGDTVSISVILDSLASLGVGGISFELNYDPQELQLQKDTVQLGSVVSDWIGYTNTNDDGKIVLVSAEMVGDGLTAKGTEIMTASFKVLKVNSALEMTNVSVTGSDDDSTDLSAKTVTTKGEIKCSHKNTEVRTQITDCAAGGSKLTVCKDCAETVKTETTAPSAHTVAAWTETQKAACNAKGEETGTCTVCGKTVTRETDMTAHTFGAWAVTTPATCTEKGVETRTCSVCGKAETRDVKALGHSLSEPTTVKAATCTEAGERAGTCTVCGKTATEEIPPLGHDWGEWEVTEKPAVGKKGSEKRVCKVCGEEEAREINSLDSGLKVPAETKTPTIKPAAVNESSETDKPKPTVSEAESISSETAASENNSSALENTSSASGKGNPPTGAVLMILPAAAAMGAVVISKKRR